ncbi:MAG: serine protease [Nibricoccus sp.]
MSGVRALFFTSLLVVATSLTAANEQTMPKGGLYKPTFLLPNRSFAAGTAFTVQVTVKKRPVYLLLSCHHVLDNTASEIRHAVGLSMLDSNQVIVGEPIKIRGARTVDFAGADGELSAFLLSQRPNEPALKISLEKPLRGERIILFARLHNQDKPQLYPGKVVSVSPEFLEYTLDDPSIEIGGTSGAPVLDSGGSVIGINASGQKSEDGTLHVLANPSMTFLPKILEALETSP